MKSEKTISYGMAVLLFLAVLVSYLNALHNQFLFDDEFLLQKNSLIRSWEHFFQIFKTSSSGGAGAMDSFYRPMQTLAYLVVYQLAGLSEVAFHLLNIFVHSLNVLLVFVLGQRLGLKPWSAFIGSLLWGVHPIHTEAVTYMSATADVLYGFFCLMSVYFFLRKGKSYFSWASLVSFLLALLSKESAAVLPVLICALSLFLAFENSKTKSFWLGWGKPLVSTWPYWLLLGTYFVARMTVLNFDETFEFYKEPNVYTENILYRIFTFWATLPEYLKLLIFPNDLHMERNFFVYADMWVPPVLLGMLLFFLLIGMLGFGVWRRRKWLMLMPLWFLGAHVPHTGVLLPVNSLFLEHWMYLPSISLFWILGEGLQKLHSPWVKILSMGLLLVAITFSVQTHFQNRNWADPITFYNHILKLEPATLRIHNNLGMAYSDVEKWGLAEEHYLQAIKLDPQSPNPRHNLGLLYLRTGEIQKGIEALRSAVEVQPDFYHSYKYLSEAYSQLGDSQKSLEYQKKFEETRAQFP